MDKKLTLSLNCDIIETAKRYAKSNNISLSKLIESYLGSLTKKDQKEVEITPLVNVCILMAPLAVLYFALSNKLRPKLIIKA